MKKNSEPKSSHGTKVAEKVRARANTYTDAKRAALLEQGLALIYGGTGYVKANRNRS